MDISHGDYHTSLSHVSADGTFQGYAVRWDGKFHDGLRVAAGAFGNIAVADIKMLHQHNDSEPIGKWLEIREDRIGLFVRGQLNMDLALAKEVHSNMLKDILNGLSIGYMTDYEEDDGVITALELIEISIVTFPSMEEATVDENTVTMHDTLALDGVRRTQDGYLTAFARVARTGIQLYKGSEVGRPDLDVVRVYRPANEVFSRDTMRSFAHRPVTNDHPPVPVNSKNWKKYAIGKTGEDVVRDGQFVKVPLVVMDESSILEIEAGKKELSQGYVTDLDWTSGVDAESGEEYDAIQRNIRNNHLAVVRRARGGDSLRIGDNNDEGGVMTTQLKKITMDGVDIEMTDVAAQVVTRSIEGLKSQIAKLEAKLAEEEEANKKAKAKDAESVTALAAKDAEIVTLKKQVEDAVITPAKLDQLVKDRHEIIERAKSLIGDKLVVDGKTVEDMQRQVVDLRVGDKAKGWTADQVAASFNTLAPPAKDNGGGHRQQDRLAPGLQNNDGAAKADASYTAYDKRIGDAWKGASSAAKQ